MTDATETTAPSSTVAMSKAVFHFKTEKSKDEQTGLVVEGKKHPAVTIDLPVPTVARLQEYLGDTTKYAKEVELLISTVTDQIYRVARGQINDFREANKDGVVTAAVLNYAGLDWTAIANMPKGERASSVPGDEDVKAFLASYLEIMPAALNKPKANIDNHLLCFQSGFKKQRSAKEILEMFQNALLVYMATATPEVVEEHLEVVEYYSGRLTKMLTAEEKLTLDNL